MGNDVSNRTYYEILDVTPDASYEEIHAAFRDLSKRNHPDVGGDTHTYQLISEAWAVLKDPNQRHQYNQKFNITTGRSRVRASDREPSLDDFSALGSHFQKMYRDAMRDLQQKLDREEREREREEQEAERRHQEAMEAERQKQEQIKQKIEPLNRQKTQLREEIERLNKQRRA